MQQGLSISHSTNTSCGNVCARHSAKTKSLFSKKIHFRGVGRGGNEEQKMKMHIEIDAVKEINGQL